MKRRDELWPTVNVAEGVLVECPWGNARVGARGTLRRMGRKYALVEFPDDTLAEIFQLIPIVCIRPSDELAAQRHRERHGEWS